MKKYTSILISAALVVLPIFAALPISDVFTDTDSTALESHGSCWQMDTGALDIQSNAAHTASGAIHVYHYKSSCQALPNDQYVQATITGLDNYIGPIARYSNTGQDNFYTCFAGGGSVFIRKSSFLGVETLGSAAGGTTGNVLRIEASGSTTTQIDCKINGSIVLSYTDTTSPLTSGQPGIYAAFGGNTALDTFQADDINAGAPTATPVKRRVVN